MGEMDCKVVMYGVTFGALAPASKTTPGEVARMLPSTQELSKLLGALYDAAADPELWSPFIEQVARACEATSAGLVAHDFRQPLCAVSGGWQLDPELQKLYEAHYHNMDVWAERGRVHPARRIVFSHALCPITEFRKTEIYNDLYVASNIEHGAFALLERTNSCLASVSLFRDCREPEFSEADVQPLWFLFPHLQRAFQLHRRFAELRERAAGLETALDMVATPVILFGQGGKIVSMNRSASEMIGERDGLLTSPEGLRAERPAESGLLAKAIERASSVSVKNKDRAGETVWISRRKGGPLQILVSPVGETGFDGNGTIRAIIFVNDPERRQRPAQDILRVRFGLTPAESRVALLLCDGRAPKDIAETIGVSVETVRSQMKSIFSKAEVRRQSELVRLLLSSCGPAAEWAKR